MTKVTVRMYRHGLGDCHLVTLTNGGRDYRMLIDCGVILGTANATEIMNGVMQSILTDTGGKVDLLVATHAHWDHVSGFVQAKDLFEKLQADEVWMGWTEDPKDRMAVELHEGRAKALQLLQPAAARMHMTADGRPTLLTTLLEFFGAAGGGATTVDAMEAVRGKKGAQVRYCDPNDDKPTEIAGFGARIYVLGPPRDVAALKRMLPSKGSDETYDNAFRAVQANTMPAFSGLDQDQPFTGPYRIPIRDGKELPFFQRRYWNQEDWRQIDNSWMEDATQFALAFDSMVNNTSLVLALEVDEVGVFLFAADAQIGNWESWSAYTWKTASGRTVDAADLLSRSVLYKVGHHGSFNATLKEGGLDQMINLQVALIPVFQDMAIKKNWGAIPLNTLVKALDKASAGRGYVLRSDEDASATAKSQGAVSTPAYFEVTF